MTIRVITYELGNESAVLAALNFQLGDLVITDDVGKPVMVKKDVWEEALKGWVHTTEGQGMAHRDQRRPGPST